MAATPTNILPALFVTLIAWRIYRRVRRTVGRQRLQPKRLRVRIAIYSALTVLLAALSFNFPKALAGLGGGLVLGALLALAGLRLTRFETTSGGRFYTPNPYIGVAVSLLFVARLVYRFTVLYSVSDRTAPPPTLMRSPLTLCVYGVLAGYYIAYFAGVLACGRKDSPLPTAPPVA
ncbi:MAG: DUF1453 domain-containing protein [Verrucomicrobiota bacterium]|jgi:hypothetical protein